MSDSPSKHLYRFVFLLSLLPGGLFAQGLQALSFGTDSTLELVTWNIEWFPKNGQATADSVAKVIQAIDADIYGIQEIDDSAFFRQVINGLPEYEVHIEPGYFRGLVYVYKPSSVQLNGVYRIFDTSPYWSAFPRSPLVMEFSYAGEDFVVINNHYKCCGDGLLDLSNSGDEEARRYEANSLLKQFIDLNFPSGKVILLGDLNDNLTDPTQHNVFRMFLNDTTRYSFTDLGIAQGPNYDWSFPGWPSHLDHIMVTNELYMFLDHPRNSAETIRVDDHMAGGWTAYDQYISDHRPVGLKFGLNASGIGIEERGELHIGLYPNPFDKEFTLDLRALQGQVEVCISDVRGRVLERRTVEGGGRHAFGWEAPSGLYWLRLQTGEASIVKKLIRE